jgi:SpoVK/Ycf46/Vps4 family AAA+-type ATPase
MNIKNKNKYRRLIDVLDNRMERKNWGNITLPIIEKKKVNIDIEIKNIKSLIYLIENYPNDPNIEYNINMNLLHKIKEPLIELNEMIGMNKIKDSILDQLLYYIQGLNDENSGDYLHTVIYGPPGTGKTEIARIIGNIFIKLGILKKEIFKKVTRSDLVAGYLGQTSIKTRDVINECLGGCLFIDEAYSLGNNDKLDSFSKECIDTLCEALSNHKNDLMVIIAGYEKELNECFFAHNQGLKSRFTWTFKIDEYKGYDLYNIFLKKIKNIGWKIEENSKINEEWFSKKMKYFKYFGRDIEVLLSKLKIAHSRRVFCKNIDEKKVITFIDLEKGFEIYLKNEDITNRINSNKLISSMYV